jgi:hypothetical protein
MEQRRTTKYMVGNLLFNYVSQSQRQKQLRSNNKSQMEEDPFLQKLLYFQNKSNSQVSILKANPRSRQTKQMNKHLSATTLCSSNYNNSTLQKSSNYSDISIVKNSKACILIKPKLHIRNKQQQLDSVFLHNSKTIADNNNNEQSFINSNNNSIFVKEQLNITQLPHIKLKNIIESTTKGSKEYAHYFKLNKSQKVSLMENVFNKLRKEYCFYKSNKSKSIEKRKIEKIFDIAESNENKVDYFHSGKSKKHILKYRFKC